MSLVYLLHILHTYEEYEPLHTTQHTIVSEASVSEQQNPQTNKCWFSLHIFSFF